MKIAVASSDGVIISRHFGRSASFIIFDVEDKVIIGREVRENTFTAHARGECDGGHDQPHSHASIVDALNDCNTVLCYGMGWRAAEDLKANDIIPYIIEQETTPEEAVKVFIDGNLKAAGDFCNCHQ